MADLLIDVQSAPVTPGAGQGVIYLDTTTKLLWTKDDAGLCHGAYRRASVASQGAGFAADTYVTNSGLLIPGFGAQAGMTFLWFISASKTAASTATPVYTIRIGAAQGTGDTARVALTGPAQTAAADVGILTIVATVRNIGASGVIQATASWNHSAASTGFANNTAGAVEGASSAFDTTALAGLYAGLSINGGASSAWTLTQCVAELSC